MHEDEVVLNEAVESRWRQRRPDEGSMYQLRRKRESPLYIVKVGLRIIDIQIAADMGQRQKRVSRCSLLVRDEEMGVF